MLYDLGLEHQQIKNATAVDEKIKEIDDNFDLVLIMERYCIFQYGFETDLYLLDYYRFSAMLKNHV